MNATTCFLSLALNLQISAALPPSLDILMPRDRNSERTHMAVPVGCCKNHCKNHIISVKASRIHMAFSVAPGPPATFSQCSKPMDSMDSSHWIGLREHFTENT